MQLNSPLLMYSASAGSGKTFSLTVHYLELALFQPGAYRHILAVTFTNKATAEMKERVLNVLQWLHNRHSKGDAYLSVLIQRDPSRKADSIREHAGKVYAAILHDYGRFSISTIDAFVQKIVRSFAWELGIDGSFNLQLSEDPVKEDLANRMYQRLDEDAQLRAWAINLALERFDEGKSWDFRREMLDLSGEIFKEKFKAFELQLKALNVDAKNQLFADMKKSVDQILRDIQDKWKREGAEMVQLIRDAGLHPEDFPYQKSSFAQFYVQVAREGFMVAGTRVRNVAVQPEKMFTKTTDQAIRTKISGISLQLVQSLQRFIQWEQQDGRLYYTALAIRQNLGLLRLMVVFAEELSAFRSDNNALLISDTHYLLRMLTADTHASFIYEKTGSRLRHFLMDEFQDTSHFQWDNFRPLLQESLSQGQFNLLVGDVKQAIYRWRNGDWRLLLDGVQRQLRAFAPEQKTLNNNHRSAVQVIQFNNLLFNVAPRLLQQGFNQMLAGASAEINQYLTQKGHHAVFDKAYQKSFQQAPANAATNGYVAIHFIPEKREAGEADFTEQALGRLYGQIQELLEEGFVASDLAILTRTNGEASAVVDFLMAAQQPGHHTFQLISGEALLLRSNQAVQTIVCALRCLYNPADTPVLAQLRLLALQHRGQTADPMEVFAANGNNSILPAEWTSGAASLRSLPVPELVHRIILMFELDKKPAFSAYLMAFYDLVQEWQRNGNGSLQSFFEYWDEDGLKKSLPLASGQDAVEVLTIHKSKGLEYKVVLMPFLNWKLTPGSLGNLPVLWVNTRQTPFGPSPFDQLELFPVRFKKDLAGSFFAADFYEETVLSVMDNINLLYVAFTRARERLYAWAPVRENKEPEKAKGTEANDAASFAFGRICDLVVAAAADVEPLSPDFDQSTDTRRGYSSENLLWEWGSPEKPPQHPGNRPPAAEAYHYARWRNRLRLQFRPPELRPDETLVLPRAQGVLLHDIISRINHPDELEPVTQHMIRLGLLEAESSVRVCEILRRMFALEAMQPWHSGAYRRLAERDIIDTAGQLRRPDLVLYSDRETIVYDFKFTADEDASEAHIRQVKQYMDLLAQLGFSGITGYLVYGLQEKVIPVQ